jgi:hypothetical protein
MTGNLIAMTNFDSGFEIISVKEPKEIGLFTCLRHLKKGAEPLSEKMRKL